MLSLLTYKSAAHEFEVLYVFYSAVNKINAAVFFYVVRLYLNNHNVD